MLKENFCMMSDCYKQTHHMFYPKNLESVYDYFESRGNNDGIKETVFFGLQGMLLSYLCGEVIDKHKIEYAEYTCSKIFGNTKYFNKDGFTKLLEKHGGIIPVKIKAVLEGSIIPTNNILASVESTDKEFAWICGFIETMFMKLWYPCTVATISRECKKIIKKYCDLSGANLSPFHLNDFGYRGVSSEESAGIGGAAHLTQFLGTDTIAGIRYVNELYGGAFKYGFSVAATEHSTTCVFSEQNEIEAYRHFLKTVNNGILSIVIDTYDMHNAIRMFGTDLKDLVMNHDGKIVFRPDSGNPAKVSVEVLDMLKNYFGHTVNKSGFIELPSQIGLIYGDGITRNSIEYVCSAVVKAGYSMNNIVFGMGKGLLQDCDRDTFKFAFKASHAIVNGEHRDIYKNPKTDTGKASKKGRLKLIKENGIYKTVSQSEEGEDLLQTVFENGKLIRKQAFGDIYKLDNI